MTKKCLVTFLAIGLALQLSGCTSGSKDGGQDGAQQQDSQFAQEGEGDFAQAQAQGGDNPQGQIQQDGQDGTKMADQNAPQDGGQDLALDGQQQPAKTDGGQKDQLSLDDPQPLPENVADDPNKQAPPPTAEKQPEMPPPTAEVAANPPPTAAPPTDEPLFKDPAKTEEAAPQAPTDTAAAPPPAPKAMAPLAKVKESAFTKDGVNLNRVYLARSSDKTLKAISQKLYGKNRAADLKKWNPIVNASSVKTGSKIYYSSPTQPEDTKMMTFYEEQGIQPKVYTTQEGDNLRKLSKNWLGSGESWKEVWSTNLELSPEQKGNLPAGMQIKYWPEDLVAGLKGGEATSGKANPAGEIPAPPPPDLNPPPPAQVAANDVPPPPPPPPAQPPNQPTVASTPDSAPANPATGAVNAAPPPPPPPPDMNQPPPPPPVEAKEPKAVPKKPKAEVAAENDPDTMMIMALGGVLVMAAAVVFVVLKKNRAKRIDLSQTQV